MIDRSPRDAQTAPELHPHWGVTVDTSGDMIVRIESECYGGREISAADEDAIRKAAHNLLAFIGDPSPADTPARAGMGAVDAAYAAGWGDACIGNEYGTQKPTPEQVAALQPGEAQGADAVAWIVDLGNPSGIKECRVSLMARQIRQTMRDYGHKSADTVLPDLIAGAVNKVLEDQAIAWPTPPAAQVTVADCIAALAKRLDEAFNEGIEAALNVLRIEGMDGDDSDMAKIRALKRSGKEGRDGTP